MRCCICGACRRTFHLRDGFRGTFRSPYGAFRRGRPQISPRAAQCAAPTDLIRLAALGTCPYPFCPFGTFPPDRGNRPKGEGFEIAPAFPFRGRCPRRGRMRYPAPGALAEKTRRTNGPAPAEIFHPNRPPKAAPNAKPSEAGLRWRGGARERAQFSPLGGNGDKRTLRRRAAMGKGTRRPQAAKSPYEKNQPAAR